MKKPRRKVGVAPCQAHNRLGEVYPFDYICILYFVFFFFFPVGIRPVWRLKFSPMIMEHSTVDFVIVPLVGTWLKADFHQRHVQKTWICQTQICYFVEILVFLKSLCESLSCCWSDSKFWNSAGEIICMTLNLSSWESLGICDMSKCRDINSWGKDLNSEDRQHENPEVVRSACYLRFSCGNFSWKENSPLSMETD